VVVVVNDFGVGREVEVKQIEFFWSEVNSDFGCAYVLCMCVSDGLMTVCCVGLMILCRCHVLMCRRKSVHNSAILTNCSGISRPSVVC